MAFKGRCGDECRWVPSGSRKERLAERKLSVLSVIEVNGLDWRWFGGEAMKGG